MEETEAAPGDIARDPRAIEVLAGLMSGGAGLAAADVGGDVAGVLAAALVSPASWDIAAAVARELGVRRRTSAAIFLDDLAARLGTSPEDMLRLVLGDQRVQPAFMDAVVAAADSANDQKVRALASALANGLADDMALIDESHLVVRALSELETPHIRVLAPICASSRADSYSLDDVAALNPGLSAATAGAVIAALTRTHILESDREAMREATAETIRLSQRAAAEDARRERRRIEVEGPELSGLIPGRRTPEAFQVRDEPAWVVTDFGILCWTHLAAGASTASGQTSPAHQHPKRR